MESRCDSQQSAGVNQITDLSGKVVGPLQQTLSVCQLNIHHSKAASAMMTRSFEEYKLDITLIQEPWIIENRIRGLSTQTATLYYPQGEGKIRTCIMVRHGIQSIPMTHLGSPDLTVVQIGSGAGSFLIASAYLPYDAPEPDLFVDLENLVKFCMEKEMRLIIGCDANAHNTVWGSTDENHRGQKLLEFVERYNLLVVNRGTSPTFVDARRMEVIDITLSSVNMFDRIQKWRVVDRLTMSDHRAIHFEIQYGRKSDSERKYKRVPRNTDRVKYEKYLLDNLEVSRRVPRNTSEIEQIVENINSTIRRAFGYACSPTPMEEKDTTPWWCSELESMKRETRKAFNHYMRRRDPESWERYKDKKRAMKTYIRQRKRSTWREFCSEMRDIHDVARLQKMISKDPVSKMGLIRKVDGSMTESMEESLQVLMEVHFPGSFRSNDSWKSVKRGASERMRLEAERIVTPNGVKSAITSFAPFKSPGMDGIFPALLQWASDDLLTVVRNIFIACLSTGYIPTAWRETRVVFLPKPGKKDYTEAKSFRPISLTSFLLKTMERILVDYLENTVFVQNPLSKSQHAYRAGRSTETALHELVGAAERELENGGIAMTTFMDIEGAFDKISFNKLSEAMVKRGFDVIVRKWINNMLKLRAVNLRNGSSSIRGKVVRGCPQGGVLSPLLWNITVDSLLWKLDLMGILAVGYADDIAIIVRGFFMDTIVACMRQALRVTEIWCNEQELTINARKSDTLIFTRKRKGVDFRPLTLFGSEINVSRNVKYLGVILDSKLSWNEHIEMKIRKATRILHQCKRVCGRRWGTSPKAMHWTYTMMVRPVITYASIVWWPIVIKKTVKSKLDRVQRIACVSVSGAFSTTPTNALEMLLGLPPLDLFIKKTAALTAIRMTKDSTWCAFGVNTGHRKILDFIYDKVKDTQMPSDSMRRMRVIERRHKTLIADGIIHNECLINDISIFTDGSLIENRAGAGVFSEEMNLSCSLSLGRYVTVYQAEMIGLLHALDHLIVEQMQGVKILLALDNQSVIRRMQQTNVNSKLVLECIQKLNKVALVNEVTLMWVRGHIGTEGNEAADLLAKKGSEAEFNGPEPRVALGNGIVRSMVNDWMISEICKRWTETTSCRQAKLAMPRPLGSKSKKVLCYKRDTLRWLAALMTGHGSFKYHLCKMKIVEDDLCRLCQEEAETAAHIVCECPALANIRRSVIGVHTIRVENMSSISLCNLLAIARESMVEINS